MLEVMSKSERLQRCGSLKRSTSSPRQPLSPHQGIQFDKVTVVAPSGKVLARDLTFQVCNELCCAVLGCAVLCWAELCWAVRLTVLCSDGLGWAGLWCAVVCWAGLCY